MYELGCCLAYLGQRVQAVQVLERCKRKQQQLFGREDPYTRDSRTALRELAEQEISRNVSREGVFLSFFRSTLQCACVFKKIGMGGVSMRAPLAAPVLWPRLSKFSVAEPVAPGQHGGQLVQQQQQQLREQQCEQPQEQRWLPGG